MSETTGKPRIAPADSLEPFVRRGDDSESTNQAVASEKQTGVFESFASTFRSQKHKIMSLFLQGIESVMSRPPGPEAVERDSIVQSISGLQDKLQTNLEVIETIFQENLQIFKDFQKIEKSLRNVVSERDAHIGFQDQMNQQLEERLNELEHDKADLEQRLAENGRAKRQLDKQIQQKRDELAQAEAEIHRKDLHIEELRRQARQDSERLRMMESETQIVQTRQKQAVQNLETIKRQSSLDMRQIDKELTRVTGENDALRKRLAEEKQRRSDLGKEMAELARALEQKELQLKAMRAKQAIGNESEFVDSHPTEKNGSQSRLIESQKMSLLSRCGGAGAMEPLQQSGGSLKSTREENLVNESICINGLQKEAERSRSGDNCGSARREQKDSGHMSMKSLVFLEDAPVGDENKENRCLRNVNKGKVRKINAFVSHLSTKAEESVVGEKRAPPRATGRAENKGNVLGVGELKLLRISRFQNQMEFINQSKLTQMQENNASRGESSEFNLSYIDKKIMELDKRIHAGGAQNEPKRARNRQISTKCAPKKSFRHFTFASNTHLLEAPKAQPTPRFLVPSIDDLQEHLSQAPKGSGTPSPSDLERIKPIKTMDNIRQNMSRHKQAIFLMTNQKNLTISSAYSDECGDQSDLPSHEDSHSQHISELNRQIRNQLNPKMDFNRRKESIGRRAFADLNRHVKTATRPESTLEQSRPKRRKRWKGSKFQDLVYICACDTKYLKYITMDREGIHLISKHSLKQFADIRFSDIKTVKLSEKDDFLVELVLKPSAEVNCAQLGRSVVIEMPARKKLESLLSRQGLSYCMVSRKTLDIEGDDRFKNYSMNVFPRSSKQGFLDVYVDEFFNDWKTFFVSLVDKTLFLFPVKRKCRYQDHQLFLRKVRIYRLISYNVVRSRIGLQQKHSFVLKIKNESTQIIFCTFSRVEQKEWLRML